jgi:hypothetical protein
LQEYHYRPVILGRNSQVVFLFEVLRCGTVFLFPGAMLFGNERLLDASEIRHVFADAATPGAIRERRLRTQLEDLGVGFDCTSFLREIRLRNIEVVKLFIQAGIKRRLNRTDQLLAQNELMALKKRDKRAVALTALFSQSSLSDADIEPGYPFEVLNHVLVARSQVLVKLLEQATLARLGWPVCLSVLCRGAHSS